MNHQENELAYDDVLRAEFTSWLVTLVNRAKKNYLRKERQRIETVSLEEITEEMLVSMPEECDSSLSAANFEFTEERLARAFSQLPLMRQQILKLLFVDELKPAEIAKQLNCSPQYVYNQRLKGLKKLKSLLEEGGENDG